MKLQAQVSRRHVHDQGRHLGQGRAVGRTHDLCAASSPSPQRRPARNCWSTRTSRRFRMKRISRAFICVLHRHGTCRRRVVAHLYVVDACRGRLPQSQNRPEPPPYFPSQGRPWRCPCSVLGLGLCPVGDHPSSPSATRTEPDHHGALLEALRPIGLAELSFQTTDGNRLASSAAVPTRPSKRSCARSIGRSPTAISPQTWRPNPVV